MLLDTGCSYQGVGESKVGPTVIHLVDQSKYQFNLDLWRLDDGHEYSELVSHVNEERRRFASHEPSLGHPTFAELVAQGTAKIGGSADLQVNLTAGVYGFVCIPFGGDVPVSIWLAGQLKVS